MRIKRIDPDKKTIHSRTIGWNEEEEEWVVYGSLVDQKIVVFWGEMKFKSAMGCLMAYMSRYKDSKFEIMP